MGLWKGLRNFGSYVGKLWRSAAPDSYYQYKRGRERERKQAEQRREDAERSGKREREEVERGRQYEERYATERLAEQPRTEAPRHDTSQPE